MSAIMTGRSLAGASVAVALALATASSVADEPYRTDPFDMRCGYDKPAEILLHCAGGDVIEVPVEEAAAICDMREQIVVFRNQKNESRALCIARDRLRTQREDSK